MKYTKMKEKPGNNEREMKNEICKDERKTKS